ncbi:MAG: glycosyltransferase involved in cell wall biosynthesis [Salibacteraceae bacterium]|jgi:glycosyltransferase involved in cell wall biosynthesis
MSHRRKLVIGITIAGSVPLIRGQAKYFINEGYDVYLLSPRGRKSIEYCEREGCKLLSINIERRISPLKDLFTLVKLIKILRSLKPDVINVGTPKMGLLGTLAAAYTKIPKIIYTCRGLRYEHEKGLMRKLLLITEKIPAILSDHIICIAPSVRKRAIRDGVFKAEKTIVIGKGSSNGIDLNHFDASEIDTEELLSLRKKYSLEGNFVFGFIGRLIDRKGINELFTAFNNLYKSYPDIRLILVGKKDQSQMSDKGLITKIESHSGIIWAGWQDNVPLFISSLDVFVMPAWWEGFGNTFLEAAAMGIPVIGTQGTGGIDAVDNGFNGITVPVKNIDALETAMKEYYLNPTKRSQHGLNGLKWVENFRQEIIWQGQQKLYEQ